MSKEIEDSNRLIAQFMGYVYYPWNNEEKKVAGWHLPTKGYTKLHGWYLCRRTNEMRYSNSWDWLMPVVDKIESMGYEIIIARDVCYVYAGEDFDPMIKYTSNVKRIDSVYNSVITFIKHINNK